MTEQKPDIGELNKLYHQAESVDKSLFSEQRGNVLLVAGDHYNKRTSKYPQSRDGRNQDYMKLRLTKNHTHKAHRHYVTSILSYGSGVSINPQLDGDIQDQKDAELNQAVWRDIEYQYRMDERFRNYCSDFVGIGEVCAVIKFNPNAGIPTGYEQAEDETGNPVFDENNDPAPDMERQTFQGQFEFERVFGFNLLRDPGAQEMQDSPYIIVRAMVNTKKLRAKYASDEEALKSITEDQTSEEFIVFDASKGGYERTNGQTLVRTFYYRPSEEYPKGYFFTTTRSGILEEGELPFGIWPIVYSGFDEHPTSPRGRSIIKQARPYQSEINRASSQQALHQITVGDDKILYQAGTKLEPGALLPGVRGLTFQGSAPTVLPGRDGGHFQGYVDSNINEMNQMLDIMELTAEKDSKGSTDVYGLLFKSAMQRQKMFIPSQKFQQFKIDFVLICLQMAKEYYTDDILIPAIGKKEMVNLAEFRKTTPMQYRVKILPQDDTLETKFGRQISIQHILQYTGTQLQRADIGRLARHLPFANQEEIFSEFTVDYDNSRNLILALERGEYPATIAEENHDYMLQALGARMKQSDFRFMPPNVQQAFTGKVQEHQQFKAQNEQKIMALKSEYIPVEGNLVSCDLYAPSPDPSKLPKRLRIPESALKWLIEKVQAQSGSLESLNSMNPAQAAGMADMMQQQGMTGQGQPGSMPNGGGQGQPMPPMQGAMQ
jgi:hypothetical protein